MLHEREFGSRVHALIFHTLLCHCWAHSHQSSQFNSFHLKRVVHHIWGPVKVTWVWEPLWCSKPVFVWSPWTWVFVAAHSNSWIHTLLLCRYTQRSRCQSHVYASVSSCLDPFVIALERNTAPTVKESHLCVETFSTEHAVASCWFMCQICSVTVFSLYIRAVCECVRLTLQQWLNDICACK